MTKKIRYAVVGAGWISQEAFMPSIEQTGNSEMTAIVSGNREGAEKLAKFYGIPHVFSYDQYDEMLARDVVDVVYVALPNSMHADYTIRALNAGVHALVEKPLGTTVEECERMVAASKAKGAMLMTAYRLHTEPGTLAAIDMIRRGEIGEPRMFNSLFSFAMAPGNHRLKAEHWGGALQDIGVYCINAVRHLFGEEPVEAIAMNGTMEGDARFAEVPEMVAATLRFPRGRLAQFICSFGGDELDQYRVVGTKGQIEVSSGYRFDKPITVRLTKDGKVTEKAYAQYDHFSGQAAYFSACILKGRQPEPDGGDGLADVAIMRAIEKAAETGQAQKITLPERTAQPTPEMAYELPMAERQLLL